MVNYWLEAFGRVVCRNITSKMKSMLRWRGKVVSEKQYKRKLELQDRGWTKKKRPSCTETQDNPQANNDKQRKTSHADKHKSTEDYLNDNFFADIDEPTGASENVKQFMDNSETNDAVPEKNEPTGANEEDTTENVVEGRRIMEIKHLGQQLWCTMCKETLSLQYILEERRQGFASIFNIRCHKCLFLNVVTTDKVHSSGHDKRRQLFDVNSKTALGKKNTTFFINAIMPYRVKLLISIIRNNYLLQLVLLLRCSSCRVGLEPARQIFRNSEYTNLYL